LALLLLVAAPAEPLPIYAADAGVYVVEGDQVRHVGGILRGHDAVTAEGGEWLLLGSRRAGAKKPRGDALSGTDLWLFSSAADFTPRCLEADTRVVSALLSPAGRRLAIWSTDFAVEVRDVASGRTLLRLAGAGDPAFSADGETLLVTRCRNAEVAFPGPLCVETVRIADGVVRRWTDGVDDTRPRALGDGSILFTSGARNGHAAYWRVTAPGAPPQLAIEVQGGTWVPTSNGELAIAPDGGSWAWCAAFEGRQEIWWADLADRRARSLGVGSSPAFTPDGRLFWQRPDEDGLGSVVCVDPPRFAHEDLLLRGLRTTEDPLRPRSESVRDAAPSDAIDPAVAALLQRVEEEAGEEPHGSPHWVGGGQPPVSLGATTFRFPLSYHPGYTGYYDNDAGGGILDWKCGTFTYNGHRGTDIAAPRWTTTYAGADGGVTQRCDGFGDGWIGNTDCGGFGNMIKLGHSDASTIYAHLQNGTPTTAASLLCGDYVGQTGTSGNSSGPHLHFEVQRYGYPYDEPFAGTCSGDESFWTNQNGGWPTTDCDGGGSGVVIDNEDPNFRLVGPPSQWLLVSGWGYGGSTRWTWNITSMPYENAAAWLFDTSAASFEVQVHIPGNYATTQSANYYIKTSGGWVGPYLVNQNQYYEEWVSLGRHNFRSGRNIVAVLDVSGEGYGTTRVAADACRILP
jgi:murein DD-endopeptidase MepM/ murein hydrolase activator NlpD